ncbi:MAG: hypothetical protein JWM74_138 [Myxococcaceae bacterium]|nr:hypothetical protein [Myxococcaceae bacterium]
MSVLRETKRPLSASERAALERLTQFSANRDLGGPITFLAVLGVLGGTAGSWLGRSIPHALPVSLAIALVVWLMASRVNLRARWREKGAYRSDLARGEAEVLEVEDPDVLEEAPGGSAGPIIVMKVSPTRVLVLSGQWLWSATLYGRPAEDDTFDEQHLNGAPEPFGFPAQRFEIAIAPKSRFVLGIRVLGPYAPPRRTLPAGTLPLEELEEIALLDHEHPAVRRAFSS